MIFALIFPFIGGLIMLWYDSVLFAHDSLWSIKGYLLMCLLSFGCWLVQAIGFKVVGYLIQLVFLVCLIAQVCGWLGLIDLPLINYVH